MGKMISKHFHEDEFFCKCGCGFNTVDPALISLLEIIRGIWDQPVTIKSGCRCKKHNADEDGKEDSAHLTGKAADIECVTSKTRYDLLLICLGNARRIGVGKTFIHLDVDDTKPQDVCWIY